MFGKLISLFQSDALEDLRGADLLNQRSKAWLQALVNRADSIRAAHRVALENLQADPNDETVAAYVAAERELFEAETLTTRSQTITRAAQAKMAERTRSPLKKALLSIVAKLEKEKAQAVARVVDEGAEYGIVVKPEDSPVVKQLASVLSVAMSYLRDVDSADWNKLAGGVQFCLKGVPATNQLARVPVTVAAPSRVPNGNGSELHDFLTSDKPPLKEPTGVVVRVVEEEDQISLSAR